MASGAPETAATTEKKRRGRPKLPPGVKGKYTAPKKGMAAELATMALDEAKKTIVQQAETKRERDKRRRESQQKTPDTEGGDEEYERPTGWLRTWFETGKLPPGIALPDPDKVLTATGQREVARAVLRMDGLVFAQELLADPRAKDENKLRTFDLLAKVGVGYITPDQMLGEDASELPAPIFQTTTGEPPSMPGEVAPTAPGVGDVMPEPIPVAPPEIRDAEKQTVSGGNPLPMVG